MVPYEAPGMCRFGPTRASRPRGTGSGGTLLPSTATGDVMARSSVVGAWVVAALVVAGAGTAGAMSSDPAPTAVAAPSPTAAVPSPTLSARSTVDAAQLATVLLSEFCDDDVDVLCGLGSGSVVDSKGLILTNAHVAAPTAPGLVQQYGEEAVNASADPPYLVVSVVPGPEAEAVPSYRASVVAVDGYADLAVLRIDAELDGTPLRAPLSLPNVPLGSLADTRKDTEIRVIGFPASAESLSPDVRRGTVTSKPLDPQERVEGPWEMNTDAEMHGGNSGGLVVDGQGRLIAVPTYGKGMFDQVFRARAVELARPLIEAAQRGASYRSPHLVPRTGEEEVVSAGFHEEDPESCQEPGVATASGVPVLYARVELRGLAQDEDVRLTIDAADGGEYGRTQLAGGPGPRCGLVLASAAEGLPLPAGTYELQVRVGPELDLIGTASIEVLES